MSAGKVVGLILGSLVLAVGVALLFGGGGLVAVNLGFADSDGFLTLAPADLERDTYAVTGEAVFEGDWIWWWRFPTTVRIRLTSVKPVFIGIAPRADLATYLTGVPHAEIEDLDFRDYWSDRTWTMSYRDLLGAGAPGLPTEQTFWRASVHGEGTQTLAWTIEPGDWMLVMMNADGTRGLDAVGSFAAHVPWLLGLGIGALVVGIVLFGVGLLVILLIARSTRAGARDERPRPEAPATEGFPLTLRADMTDAPSPALWLIKWFLLIPHFIVLPFLWFAFCVSWILSFVAILFTGRYPRGLFDYNVGVLRWTWRVGYYSYQALGTDRYPPFRLRAGGYPADLDVPYPERLSRGLVLVKWWLLAVPHYIIGAVFQGGGGFQSWGLVFILTIFAGVALLFTGKYPKDIFRLVVGMNRWSYRVCAYAALMTDAYPPFKLEE